jgi:hypothetical protein
MRHEPDPHDQHGLVALQPALHLLDLSGPVRSALEQRPAQLATSQEPRLKPEGIAHGAGRDHPGHQLQVAAIRGKAAERHHGLALDQGAEQDHRIAIRLDELLHGSHDRSPLLAH